MNDELLDRLIREADPARPVRNQELNSWASEADFIHKVEALIDGDEECGGLSASTPKAGDRKTRRLAVAGIGAVLILALSTALMLSRPSSPTIQGSGFDALSGLSPSKVPILNGRYTKTVTLDDGTFIVNPAPKTVFPIGTLSSEASKIWATSQLAGYAREAVGFGLVTMSGTQKDITRMPAWIGFASDAGEASSCPFSDTGTKLPQSEMPQDQGQAAVVIESRRNVPGFTYVARSYVCSQLRAGRILPATEELSVPWGEVHAIGSYSLRLRASIPACARLSGYSVRIMRAHLTIAATAIVPDEVFGCKSSKQSSEIVLITPSGVPNADRTKLARVKYRHASLGPIPTALARRK